MLCRHSISFIWTVVRAPPNTVQGILRFWRTFSFGWYEAFQKHSPGPCSPKHSPKSFTVLKNHFLWMLCGYLNTFKFMAGPRSPISPVTAQLISRLRRIISLGCCADMQQRSNKRMVALPQTHSRSFHGVEDFSHLDGMKHFKNIRTYGWAVLSQTRPSSFHGVEEPFCLMLCSRLNTFKLMAGPRSPTSPVTAQLISQRWEFISFWCWKDFKQRLNERLVVLPQTRSSVFHGVEDSFHLDSKKLFKNIRTYGWAVLPNIPCHGPAHFAALKNHFVLMLCGLSPMSNRTDGRVPPNTVPLIWRYGRTFSFGWYEAFQKHSCSPKHNPAHFTVLKNYFVWIVWSVSKTFELMAGPCSPKHGPVFFTVLKTFFFLHGMKFSKTFELMAGLWSSKHSPVMFTVLNIRFVWMFCSRLETFKFLAGPRSPISLSQTSSFCGVEDSIRFDVMQFFMNVQMNGWSCSDKHGPVLITMLKNLLVWMLCSHVKHSSLWLGRAPQHPLSRPSSFRGVKESFRFDVM